ncbi:MAG: shikimate kinase [Kiritimatiellaceae bacterium]|nr:shikimate kinase [Kiritimatiellaceae bacterium]
MKKQNIILIGFMGTGKTATGRVLATRTGMPWIDMDERIEQRQQKTISEIFAQNGEPAFRAMERELVQELSQLTGYIISTGGGVVLNPDNISDFEKTGLVVCLTASPETILQRLETDTSRPLLSGDRKNQSVTLLEKRKPLYNAIPHQINSDRLNPEERADAILTLYALEC